MKKAKRRKRKKKARNKTRTLTAGWTAFFVLGAGFGAAIWLALSPFLSRETHVLAKLAMVVVLAAVCSAFATYALNSVLAAWSKWRRKRS